MNLDPKLQLTKKQESASQATANNQNAAQSLLIEGRMLVSRSAFVGHSFLAEDQEVVTFVKSLLKEMQINCSTGEAAEAYQV